MVISDREGKNSFAPSLEGGLVFSYVNHSYFSFFSEASFLKKKWRNTYSYGNSGLENKIIAREWNYNYVGINIMTNLRLIRIKSFFVYAELGVFLNYLLSIDTSKEYIDRIENSIEEIHYLSDHRLEYGLGMGGGIGINLSFLMILLDAKFNLSLSDVKNSLFQSRPSSSRFVSVPIGIRMLIPINRKEKVKKRN